MSIDFSIEPISEKPKKVNARKERSSKYQSILTTFLESGHELVRVDGTGLSGSYLATVLNRIIKKLEIRNVKVSVRNGALYIEKISI